MKYYIRVSTAKSHQESFPPEIWGWFGSNHPHISGGSPRLVVFSVETFVPFEKFVSIRD